jgi:galactokinase
VDESLAREAAAVYERVFGAAPECFSFAPGRVEILGNHTDHNAGCVMSVAIELGVAAAAGRAPGAPGKAGAGAGTRAGAGAMPHAEVWSEAFGELACFPLAEIAREEGSWSNYPRGVLREIARSGVALDGLRLALVSSLPAGAGLSSSAALELAVAEAVYELFGGRPQDPLEEAELCRRAEASFVGVPCGLLDQFSSLFGRKDHALFLDCLSLRHERTALPRGARIVIADTGAKHALADGSYAELKGSFERASRRLGELLERPVRRLRDVTREELERLGEHLAPDEWARASHFIAENERVLAGLDALKRGDIPELGRLMLASHASSRDLLESSTPELDFLVDQAAALDGVLGAKLTGGGFGGATVNLIAAGAEEGCARRLEERFERRFGRPLRTIVSGVGAGARATAAGSARGG